MCGFIGIINCGTKKPISEELLTKMRDTMIHRGPDGSGLWISDDWQAGLGHRRLSIIDLSEEAGQPMCNEDGRLWTVFNGEIYNHGEIREELISLGHRFKTDHSDTEAILHAFEEWGAECVRKFRGMFAFAVWDQRRRECWLFRDRAGLKPLYYTFQNGRFMFASEIKAVLRHSDVTAAVDREGLYHYLSFLAAPAPYTLFKGIKKLPNACYAKVNSDGRIDTRRYWDVWERTQTLAGVTEDEIAHRLLDELKTSVRYRKISDVPVGVFLSGGLDSSTNAALFSEGEAGAVKTFTVGYDRDYAGCRNEFTYARVMAGRLKADHRELRLNVDDFIDFLPRLIYHQDEPMADTVSFPIFSVSALARESGVIVSQVGEGSDELFCGYSDWLKFIRLQSLSGLPAMRPLGKYAVLLLRNIRQHEKVKFEWLRRASSGEPVFWGGAEAYTEGKKRSMLSTEMKREFQGYSSYEAIRPIRERFMRGAREKSPLEWMSYLDLNLRLPELLLTRLDKMSMIASLEARAPFLDHKFVELAMSVPSSIKTKNNTLKYILKKAVRGYVPDELIDREKQGFSTPIADWMSGALGEFAAKKIRAFAKDTDLFSREYLNGMLNMDKKNRLWPLLNFILWHEMWIEGAADKEADGYVKRGSIRERS